MRKFKFEKLVRDKIVDGITKSGNIPHWRTLSEEEYLIELKKKIIEEAIEMGSAENEDLEGELADIQEIIDNILEVIKVTKTDFEKTKNSKNIKAGSFKKRQFIEYVEASEDSPWLKHYLASPDKYLEIK